MRNVLSHLIYLGIFSCEPVFTTHLTNPVDNYTPCNARYPVRYLNIKHSWIFPARYIFLFYYTIRTNGTHPFARFSAYKYSNQNVLQTVH